MGPCTLFPHRTLAKFPSLCGISHGYFETSSSANLYILSLAGWKLPCTPRRLNVGVFEVFAHRSVRIRLIRSAGILSISFFFSFTAGSNRRGYPQSAEIIKTVAYVVEFGCTREPNIESRMIINHDYLVRKMAFSLRNVNPQLLIVLVWIYLSLCKCTLYMYNWHEIFDYLYLSRIKYFVMSFRIFT